MSAPALGSRGGLRWLLDRCGLDRLRVGERLLGRVGWGLCSVRDVGGTGHGLAGFLLGCRCDLEGVVFRASERHADPDASTDDGDDGDRSPADPQPAIAFRGF